MATLAGRDAVGAGAVTNNEIPVRPTVFIGIGGTGAQVLLRLRRRILSHRWNGRALPTIDDFPIARFLLIDLDRRPTVQSDIAPETDPYLEAISLDTTAIRPSDFQPGLYMANLRNHPAIEAWMPTGELGNINFQEGAGQIRAISRLLFWDQIETIHDEVMKRAREVSDNVTKKKLIDSLGLEPEKDLRAVVVAGLAGGTGSGMFLDVGLFLRSLTGPDFRDVDAYLLAPTLFGQHGTRTLANGFAALAELEKAMTNRPFIQEWRGKAGGIFRVSEDPDRQLPFSQCYLFDAANLSGNRTQKPETLYDLMADSLFEDFGTSSFAGFKRSARVNQAVLKNQPYLPPLLDGDPHLVMKTLSRRYSALGQAVLVTSGALDVDAAVEEATWRMLASFFGLALGSFAGSERRAQQQDRDGFMRRTLGLTDRTFEDFPEHLKPRPAAISAFALLDMLLADGTQSIEAKLAEDIGNSFVELRSNYSDIKDWETAARQLASRFKGDVIPKTGASAILEKKVAELRSRLRNRWFSDDAKPQSGSLLDALFGYIDDRERGGIDFTMSLIEEVRLALERPEGPIGKLEEAAAHLREAGEKLHGAEFDTAVASMAKAAKGGLLGPDRKSADRYLENARSCLADGLRFQLRAAAAKEAAALLRDTIEKLGRRVPGEDVQERYDGLMGELHSYRMAVEQLMDDARLAEEKIANQKKTQGGGTAMVIDSGLEDQARKKVMQEAAGWAGAAFENLGKCRALLPRLKDPKGKVEILSTLRASARERLSDVEQKLPTITEALASSGNAEDRLRDLLSWAMPWIEKAPTTGFKPDSKQFMMVVATGDEKFAQAYGGKLSTLAPQQGISPQLASMGNRQTLICYTELSAYPLDYLAGVRDSWKRDYETRMFSDQGAGFPLHIHKDRFSFPPPCLPTQAELDRTKADIALLLKSVLLGVLRRNPQGDYEFNTSEIGPANWLRVGSEIAIRRRGFSSQYQAKVIDRVTRSESEAGPWLLSALALLADDLATGPYHPIILHDETNQQDRLMHGLGFKVARQLAADWRRLRAERFPGSESEFADMEQALLASRNQWSEAIEESMKDVPPGEAEPKAPKRWLRHIAREEKGLKGIVRPDGVVPPPPPPPAGPWYWWDGTATKGPYDLQSLRRMVADGRITQDSLVAMAGSKQWDYATTIPGLFEAPPPPPPPVQ